MSAQTSPTINSVLPHSVISPFSVTLQLSANYWFSKRCLIVIGKTEKHDISKCKVFIESPCTALGMGCVLLLQCY